MKTVNSLNLRAQQRLTSPATMAHYTFFMLRHNAVAG